MLDLLTQPLAFRECNPITSRLVAFFLPAEDAFAPSPFPHARDMLSHTDICRWLDGSEFMGERLVVQFARGSNRPHDDRGYQPRMAPRPRRTVHRMTITGLPFETSWQVSIPLPSRCTTRRRPLPVPCLA